MNFNGISEGSICAFTYAPSKAEIDNTPPRSEGTAIEACLLFLRHTSEVFSDFDLRTKGLIRRTQDLRHLMGKKELSESEKNDLEEYDREKRRVLIKFPETLRRLTISFEKIKGEMRQEKGNAVYSKELTDLTKKFSEAANNCCATQDLLMSELQKAVSHHR